MAHGRNAHPRHHDGVRPRPRRLRRDRAAHDARPRFGARSASTAKAPMRCARSPRTCASRRSSTATRASISCWTSATSRRPAAGEPGPKPRDFQEQAGRGLSRSPPNRHMGRVGGRPSLAWRIRALRWDHRPFMADLSEPPLSTTAAAQRRGDGARAAGKGGCSGAFCSCVRPAKRAALTSDLRTRATGRRFSLSFSPG